ncbi:hypothetical protein AAFF_G00336990 [Aldrovandia affinis]|uniref:Uncharacterized protein n=1 Tax=Aldrovandia affinis TaxID=143900 RepID=A0AAD7SKR0_9TELE|nr:hypothetical protein AAFF_G00336990 [Aldrovandia affinis]
MFVPWIARGNNMAAPGSRQVRCDRYQEGLHAVVLSAPTPSGRGGMNGLLRAKFLGRERTNQRTGCGDRRAAGPWLRCTSLQYVSTESMALKRDDGNISYVPGPSRARAGRSTGRPRGRFQGCFSEKSPTPVAAPFKHQPWL